MRTERAFNPTPFLVHALAIAAGLLAGWWVMDRITPTLPSADPGVESSSAPASVAGNDPDSLFLPANFARARAQVSDQLAAGRGVVRLHLSPGSISVDSSDADGTFALSEVPAIAPLRIAGAIHDMDARTSLGDIKSMDLVATLRGPRWYVQVDARGTGGPTAYSASLSGTQVAPAGAPPRPIDG